MKKLNIPQMEPWFDEKEARAVYKYMQSGGWVTEYKITELFERKIADFTGAGYCTMCVNGTASLILALMALELTRGDEVIIPDLTMIATPNACSLLGIRPILVDVEPDTLCLDLEKAKKALSQKTKAIIYVPFNGRSGNMKAVLEFTRKHNLFLIEDAAQAFGSYWNGKHLGTFGDIGTFSFSSQKIISTGQGGAVITNSEILDKKIKRLKDQGRTRGGIDIHRFWGLNFKFTDIQAVIGIEQLKKLKMRIDRKREIYKRYLKGLEAHKQIEFIPTDLANTTPWFIDIYVANPTKLAEYLGKYGITTRRLYPPIHAQKIYKAGYSKEKFKVTERYSRLGLWLPSSAKLTKQEIDNITECIRNFYSNLR